MAMTITDDDSARPSFRAMIEDLAPGDSFARAMRFDGDAVTKEGIQLALRRMRLATQPAAQRVAVRTGRVFTIEHGEFRTLSRDVMLCLVVTRTS